MNPNPLKFDRIDEFGRPIIRSTVIATFTIDGFHRWPGAPEQHWHLGQHHRHRFGWRIEVEVFPGSDVHREIEFQHLGDKVRDRIVAGRDEPIRFGDLSCEGLARLTMNETADFLDLPADSRPRFVAVEVWEDDNHGARIEGTI